MKLKIINKLWASLVLVVALINANGLAQNKDQIDYVLEINPEVRAAQNAYKSALENVKISGVLPEPKIEGVFSVNSIETRNGPVENQIMLGQKFPLWGKLKKERNIQKIKSEISRLQLEATKVKTAYLFRKYNAEYNKLSKSLDILVQYRDELETFKAVAQTQYANGLGLTQHPIIKLQIEEALVKTKINTLESALEKTTNDLQALYDGQFNIDQLIPDFQIVIKNLESKYWIEVTNSYSPKYLIAQARIAIANDQYKLSKLKNYPDLVAGITYTMVGPTDLGGAVSSGKDAFGIKAGINIPLWFGKNKAQIKSASYTLNQQEQLLTDTWNYIESDIYSTVKELIELKETFKLYDESIIYDADQMLSSAYAAYETGKISFIDLLDSVRLGVKVKLEYEEVIAKQSIMVAKLFNTAGLIWPTQEVN